ncbi:hypothetical protein LQ327_27765 [Actinomycetospora endophytica]|uniref:YbaB/EbfC DNA-binding family protein n=1 Tax=Actinomycetospora endophytica TaxID=2291215 RepID=A0ABS8PFZ0_9PSEU|nr:hypothetical protein [Actinomycetospora endophytica]MCD2197175.1 hypothetical protein [Actinomycetospora endophytica]
MTTGPDDGGGALEPRASGAGGVEPTGLGPMADVAVLAQALRTDRADVASYARVLSGALGDALPPGTVQVGYRRGLSDRLAGREGRAESVLVHGEGRDLELRAEGERVHAEVRRVSGGVVISRRRVDVEQWLQALAEDLSAIAARDASARQAFERWLRM